MPEEMNGNITPNTQQNVEATPLTDAKNEPVQDGQIPLDSSAITNGNHFDAVGMQNIDAQFQSGNYAQFKNLPQQIMQVVTTISRTVEPLIEVALIELTGSSQSYTRHYCNIIPTFDDKFKADFEFQFEVAGYIGTDIEYESLMADSTYILNKLKPAGVNITKCEIDSSNGIVTVRGNC